MPETAPITPPQLARRARAAMRKAADPRVARGQRMFFKPWEKIHLLGIKTPHLRAIERELYQSVRKSWSCSDAVAFCDLLMRDRSMESKSLGLMLLARYDREFQADLLDYAERWLAADLCDNWAVTDQLCTQIISRILDQYEHQAVVVAQWRDSTNLWLRRASLVSFVKPAGRGRHLETVYEAVSVLLPDTHDLIHKAAGWLLREAGKAEARRLETYLLAQGPRIPRTTVRYAIERLPESKHRKILEKPRAPQGPDSISSRRGKSKKCPRELLNPGIPPLNCARAT